MYFQLAFFLKWFPLILFAACHTPVFASIITKLTSGTTLFSGSGRRGTLIVLVVTARFVILKSVIMDVPAVRLTYVLAPIASVVDAYELNGTMCFADTYSRNMSSKVKSTYQFSTLISLRD